MAAPKRVLVAGEINADLVLQGGTAFPTPGREVVVDACAMVLGSASAICAMGLARLGTPVAFVGVVGGDAWGDYCVRTMAASGIDMSAVRRDPALTTGVTVSISSPSDRALVTYLGAIAALTQDDVSESLLDAADHLHVSSYYFQKRLQPGCRALFARATNHGLTTSLDPGCDPDGRGDGDLRRTLDYVDVFLPNEIELAGITGSDDPEAALRSLENGRTLTVVKLGARGAMAHHQGQTIRCPALEVTPIDTTGAGDSFNAGFLHAWLGGRSVADALVLGAACGAISTLRLGGTDGQPTLEEAETFIKGSHA